MKTPATGHKARQMLVPGIFTINQRLSFGFNEFTKKWGERKTRR
jgi:hypothetical protein